MKSLRPTHPGRLWAQVWLPYCLQKLPHPNVENVWLPLNRLYKPLGIADTSMRVRYEDFYDRAVVFEKCPAPVPDMDLIRLHSGNDSGCMERVMHDARALYQDELDAVEMAAATTE